MAYFKIGSVDFSSYVQAMKVDYEVLLSSNSGRNAAGDNVVDIVNRKDKIQVTFKPLTENEMNTLLTAIDDYVITVQYLNPKTKQMKTITAYIGTPSIDYYRIINGKILFKAFDLSFIEM